MTNLKDYRLSVTSEPAEEPVTVAELKSWARIDSSDDDTLLAALIADARTEAESMTGRAFVTTTFELWLRSWPSARFILPRANLIAVSSVQYVDDAEATQTVATSVYSVHAPAGSRAQRGEIALKANQEWPTVGSTEWPIKITYTAGYGAAEDVPEGIKSAIKLLATQMYEQRELEIVGSITSQVKTFKSKLDPYRVL